MKTYTVNQEILDMNMEQLKKLLATDYKKLPKEQLVELLGRISAQVTNIDKIVNQGL